MNAVSPIKDTLDCAMTQEFSETAASAAPPARLTIVTSKTPETLS